MSAPTIGPSAEPGDLRARVISNLGYAGLWKGLTWILNWGVAIALARLLARSDFGVFLMATVLTGFFARLSEMGVAAALVQRQKDDEATLETAFTLRFVALVGAAILLAGLAPLWAALYGEPALKTLVWSLLPPTVAAGLFFIPSVRLYRDMRHGRQRFAQFLGEAAKGAGAVTAALLGAGVWSFVIGVVAGNFATWICFYAFEPWTPRFRFDRAVARELFGFGRFVVVAGLFGWVIMNVDNAIVGRRLGADALGDYGQAYTYGSWAVAEVAQLLSETLFPAFARRQADLQAQRRAYRSTLRATAAAIFPITIGLAVVAPDFVQGVLDPSDHPGKWAGVVRPLQILCAFGAILSFDRVSHPVLFASGRPRAVTIGQGAMLAVLVAALPLMIGAYGLPGAAAACVFAATVSSGIVVTAACKRVALPFREFASDLAGPLVTAAAMGGAVLLVGWRLEGAEPLVRLGAQVGTGVAAYLLFGRVLMPAAQREILGEAGRLFRRGPARAR